jgi:hypothetical protein
MTQKLGFYVNLEKCEIAAKLVKCYGEYLQDMPLEERLTFRAALCVYQILKIKVATLTEEDIPSNRELVVDAITLALFRRLDVRAAYPLDYRLCLRREDADTP